MYIFLFRHFKIIFSNTPPSVPCLILIVFLLVPHPSPVRPLILICKLANIQFTEHFVSLSTNCCCQTAKLILIQHQTFKQRVPNIWNVSLGLRINTISGFVSAALYLLDRAGIQQVCNTTHTILLSSLHH